MNIRSYDPAGGQAFQGDVSIIPIPDDIVIARTEEIAPVNGRLILQEGEASGHHHAVELRQRPFQGQPRVAGDPLLATRSAKPRGAPGGASKRAAGSARMFRDGKVIAEMMRRNILTRSDLAIGCLVVEGAPMAVTHEEHDSISLPPGQYLIGRQVESVGAEQRIVAD